LWVSVYYGWIMLIFISMIDEFLFPVRVLLLDRKKAACQGVYNVRKWAVVQLLLLLCSRPQTHFFVWFTVHAFRLADEAMIMMYDCSEELQTPKSEDRKRAAHRVCAESQKATDRLYDRHYQERFHCPLVCYPHLVWSGQPCASKWPGCY